MKFGRTIGLLAMPALTGPSDEEVTASENEHVVTTSMTTIAPEVRLPAWSEMVKEFGEAKAAYDRGEYEIAMELLRPLAELGDARAQTNLGFMYAEGQGVLQDYTEALKWYLMAAEQGFAIAQVEVGAMYEYGLGVQRHDFTAIKWYRKAAEQGDADAQCCLGNAYVALGFEFIADGDLRDFIEAMKWYHLAANQGSTSAQFNLGSMYSSGEGVPRDTVQSYMWFELAARTSSASKYKDHIDAGCSRKLLEKSMTPGQIAEAQRLAREWLSAHPK